MSLGYAKQLNRLEAEIKQLKTQRDELLEALGLIASCDETCYVDGHGYIDIEEIAKKAIAKAKGE